MRDGTYPLRTTEQQLADLRSSSFPDRRQLAADYDALAARFYASNRALAETEARLAEAVTLLEAIDNADAITIDRDFPAVDVAIAEALWESIHRITTEYAERPADSASVDRVADRK